MSIEATANAFFAAIENGDAGALNQLYADAARIWHNFDQVTQTKAEGIQTLMQFAAIAESKYVVTERLAFGDRLIQRHDLHVKMRATGAKKVIPIGMFMTIRDGQVHDIHEYLDSAAVAEVLKSLGEAA